MDSKLLGQQYYYGIATYNVNQLTTWDWTPKSTLKQQLRVPKSRATGSPSHCSNKHCTAVEVGSGNRFRWRSYQSDCHKPLHPPPSYSLNPPLPKGQPCASITCTAVSTFGAYSPECGQATAPRSAKQRCGMTSLGRRSIQTCSRSTEPALLNPGSE